MNKENIFIAILLLGVGVTLGWILGKHHEKQNCKYHFRGNGWEVKATDDGDWPFVDIKKSK